VWGRLLPPRKSPPSPNRNLTRQCHPKHISDIQKVFKR
jgi:hypothetical protein